MGGAERSCEPLVVVGLDRGQCVCVSTYQSYDVTTYLAEHPGGDDILISFAGTDATEKFQSVNHTAYAKSLRNARLVGAMTSDPMPSGYLQTIKKQKRTLMVNAFLMLSRDRTRIRSTAGRRSQNTIRKRISGL